MPPKKRRPKHKLMAPVDNPERLTRRAVGAPPSSEEESSLKRRDENTFDHEELMERFLEETSNLMNIDRDS